MESYDLILIIPPFHMRSGSSSFFPLGTGYIYSIVQQEGFSIKVVNCTEMINSYFAEDLETLKSKLYTELVKISVNFIIGIGPCMTSQIKALPILFECCKTVFPQTPVFFGGPLASIPQQEWYFFEHLHADYIVKGDGEYAIVEILKTLKKREKIEDCSFVTTPNTKNFCLNEVENLDLLPFPYRDSSFHTKVSYRRTCSSGADKVTATMITSRGCYYNCFYCVSGNREYFRFRKRSISNILCEMQHLKLSHGVNDIIFFDDCFFFDKHTINSDVEKFCTALIKENLGQTWQMEIRTDILCQLTIKSIRLLEESGCRQINIGIEKTDDLSLRILGKGITFSETKKACQIIKSNSRCITLAGTFIIGGSNETELSVRNLIRDSTTLNLDYANYNPLFVYPGTRLYKSVFNDNRAWVNCILEDNLPWGEIVYTNETLSREDILFFVHQAYDEFYTSTTIKTSGKHTVPLEIISDRFNLGVKF